MTAISISLSHYLRLRIVKFSIVLTALILIIGIVSRAAAATHISFGPHKHKIVIKGKLDRHHSSHSYLLHGKHGEKVSIGLHDVNPKSIVALYSITFPNGTTYGMKGYPPYQGTLTQTGTYKLTVNVNSMASNGTHGKFVLTLRKH